jgi:hypothetical protein
MDSWSRVELIGLIAAVVAIVAAAANILVLHQTRLKKLLLSVLLSALLAMIWLLYKFSPLHSSDGPRKTLTQDRGTQDVVAQEAVKREEAIRLAVERVRREYAEREEIERTARERVAREEAKRRAEAETIAAESKHAEQLTEKPKKSDQQERPPRSTPGNQRIKEAATIQVVRGAIIGTWRRGNYRLEFIDPPGAVRYLKDGWPIPWEAWGYTFVGPKKLRLVGYTGGLTAHQYEDFLEVTIANNSLIIDSAHEGLRGTWERVKSE